MNRLLGCDIIDLLKNNNLFTEDIELMLYKD